MNAANILKPALSRGEVQVIGATTFNEYRKYIEKDSALERRFQPVKVGEPTIAQTVDIIAGVKGYYEQHHHVTVDNEIVRKTVVLSERYITDRFLPDKAIDLLDESCACAALRNKNMEKHDKLIDEQQKLNLQKEAISTADEIDYEKLANVNTALARVDSELSKIDPETLVSKVTEEDIATVIELWTGIPASRIRENELAKLAGIEDALKKKIIGQDEAVEVLASAIKRSRVQISPRRRPASFIFVGPTGVGKTELVKVLSQELFDTPETLIRLDMSEFMEKHSVSKIIGSPPGYVGYEEGGQLTEAVRRKPYSVVLFDEVEKAHPDVFNILLQVLDDGRITDSQGRTVDFKNTVIILTSNLGSDIILNDLEQRRAQGSNELSDEAKHQIDLLLRSKFRPEFLNRLDEIVYYKSLTKDEMRKIVDLQLADLRSRMDEGKHLNLDVTTAAKDYIIDSAYDSVYGARPIKRFIQSRVETLIAKAIIQGRYAEGSTLTVDYDGNALVLK